MYPALFRKGRGPRGGTEDVTAHADDFIHFYPASLTILFHSDLGEVSEDANEQGSKPLSLLEPADILGKESNQQTSETISQEDNDADGTRTEPEMGSTSLDELSLSTKDGQETETETALAEATINDLHDTSTAKRADDDRSRHESDGSIGKSPLSDDDDDDEDDDDRDCRRRRRRKEGTGGWAFSTNMPIN